MSHVMMNTREPFVWNEILAEEYIIEFSIYKKKFKRLGIPNFLRYFDRKLWI